ncbi:MAG: biopolymer transporter ExbD [Planctomycetota bacterium]
MARKSRSTASDVDMNMTPMIDVVFNLIIFFMIVTDMTQQELEAIVLPLAYAAVEDKPDPNERRIIVNVDKNGSIKIKRKEYFIEPDKLPQLAQYLRIAADQSPKDEMGLPEKPILIRADQETEFWHVQEIMEVCGQQGIQIWKVNLACSQPAE